ncbi:MAG: hypothetical protein IT458_05535 [Planctomycetes bacterium]|nr:hypothetical protein [Planctomycetota bacterium]
MRTGLLLLVAGSLAAQQPPGMLTREQMQADLRQLAAETAREWAYAEDRRRNAALDLPALAQAMIPRLDAVQDPAGFAGLVREFVAALQDGHAFVTWSGSERLPFHRWPVTVVDTPDGLVVDTVLPTWTGAVAPFLRGDVVLAVDGTPLAERIAAAARHTNASTAAARRAWAVRDSLFNAADPARYTVRRADGSEATFTAAAAAHHPEARAVERRLESRRLAAGVAYLRIPTFAHADAKAWAAARPAERPTLLANDIAALRAAFADARSSRALVLDLRGNGGGTDLLGMEVAACLLPSDSIYYGLSSRGFLGGWSRPVFHRLRVAGEPPRFAGQLLVLVDEGAFSTTDNLCRCLDDLHPDVTFVGRPTGGGTGAPRACVTLRHSRIVVGFCTMRVYGPKGELIEGRGTTPDVPVVPTRADVVAGRDPDLAAALRLVR